MEDAALLSFMAATAVAAAALIWVAVTVTAGMLDPVRRRLRALSESGVASAVHAAARDRPGRLWELLEPKREAERTEVQMRLVRAGFRDAGALGGLYAAKLGLALTVPVVAFLVLQLTDAHLSMLMTLTVVLGGAFAGSLLPDLWLARVFAKRREKLMEALPDALDLLVTCTEAGLGLNAALERVVEQMPASQPELASELGQVNAEIRAGIDRNLALKNLGERSGLEEIHGLVSLISHSTRLGTGIAGTLRIYAEDFRDRRMQRAEEVAATVSTKLIFPLLFCLFPSFFVISIGPAIIGVVKALTEK